MPRDLPPEIDTTKPSVARIYDAGLGGKDNYEVDRAVLRTLLDIDPDVMLAPKENRQWLIRITRYLAQDVGIRQFLDLGAGLPTAQNTHQVAQWFNPEANVVYVDNDPVVEAHARALLVENEYTRLVSSDLTQPERVLSDPSIDGFLDFTEPLALFQLGTLHHHPDTAEAASIMRRYVDALAPGSYVAVGHFHNPGGEDGEMAEEVERQMVDGPMGSGYFRSFEEIASLFPEPLRMLEPGLVRPPEWWPDGPPEPLVRPLRLYLVGMAYKP